jgi:hypothetical protein
MRTPKNQIKKYLNRLIRVNDTIPDEAIPGLLKESYKNFLGHLKDLKNIFGLQNYEYQNGLIIFTALDGMEYLYQIESDGNLTGVTEKLHREHLDFLDSKEQAYKS